MNTPDTDIPAASSETPAPINGYFMSGRTAEIIVRMAKMFTDVTDVMHNARQCQRNAYLGIGSVCGSVPIILLLAINFHGHIHNAILTFMLAAAAVMVGAAVHVKRSADNLAAMDDTVMQDMQDAINVIAGGVMSCRADSSGGNSNNKTHSIH